MRSERETKLLRATKELAKKLWRTQQMHLPGDPAKEFDHDEQVQKKIRKLVEAVASRDKDNATQRTIISTLQRKIGDLKTQLGRDEKIKENARLLARVAQLEGQANEMFTQLCVANDDLYQAKARVKELTDLLVEAELKTDRAKEDAERELQAKLREESERHYREREEGFSALYAQLKEAKSLGPRLAREAEAAAILWRERARELGWRDPGEKSAQEVARETAREKVRAENPAATEQEVEALTDLAMRFAGIGND